MKKLVVVLCLIMVGSAFGLTKQDMLDTLATRFNVVGEPQLVSDTLPGYNVRWYQVPVFDIDDNDVAVGRTFHIYVCNEGLSDESAYVSRNISPPTVDSFIPAIKAYLVDQLLILKQVTSSDIEALWAECEVWEYDSVNEVFIAKKVLVRKVGQNLTHKDIN